MALAIHEIKATFQKGFCIWQPWMFEYSPCTFIHSSLIQKRLPGKHTEMCLAFIHNHSYSLCIWLYTPLKLPARHCVLAVSNLMLGSSTPIQTIGAITTVIYSLSISASCYSRPGHDVRLGKYPHSATIMVWMGVLPSLTSAWPGHPHPQDT